MIERQQAELDKIQMDLEKLKEKDDLNKQRARLVVNSKKDGAESKAMEALIKKVVNSDLWKVCKFIRNEAFQKKAARLVLKKLNLQEMQGLEGDELEAAETIWINNNKSMITRLLNDRRNYVIQQLGKVVVTHAADGKLDELPNVEQMKKLVKRNGMDSSVLEKEELDNMLSLFDKYWDVLLPIVAGNTHWATKHRWHNLLSFAKRDKDDPDSEALIHPSDEAFLLIAWQNSYKRWVYKGESGDDFDEKDPKAQTKYSSSPLGIKAYGQWDPAGIIAFSKVTDQVTKQRLPNDELDNPEDDVQFITDLEKEALERIRKAHNVKDDGPAQKKTKKSGKVNVFDAEECDMDDDDAW